MAQRFVRIGGFDGTARAAVDLLFRESLRRQFVRLERFRIGVGVVCRRILLFVPFAAVLASRQFQRLQINGAVSVRRRICTQTQPLTQRRLPRQKIVGAFFVA